MHIHTVAPSESLWSISRIYNVPYQSIAAVNAIPPPYRMVIGEGLLIPQVERRYIVRPGDSLWGIARRFNSSVDEIMSANNIPPSGVVQPGQVIIIPAESKIFGTIDVNAYIEPTGNTAQEVRLVEEVAHYLTYLCVFSYRVQENGSIISPPGDQQIINTARRRGVAPLMVLTNFRSGTFDTDLAHVILTSPTIQTTLINNIVQILRTKNFYGVNIDFEHMDPDDRDLYTGFVRRVRDAVKPLGYSLSTALAPKTSAAQVGAWYEAHDYGAHGALADFVILMTYEWGWSGGPPLPVAPINEVKKVLDYAVIVIPRNKIMMGMPLYGYDWVLPFIHGGTFARRVSPVQAVERAVRFNTRIQYDWEARSPFFNYYDPSRVQHIVWFEDPRSMMAKFRVINQYRLRGGSYWVLGSEFPQNWYMLEDLFNIRKVLR